MEKILVTGGAGFIGRHLVKKLLEEKKRVIVLDNLCYSGNLSNLSGLIEEPILIPKLGDDLLRANYRVERDSEVFSEERKIERVLKKLDGLSYKFLEPENMIFEPPEGKAVLVVGSILNRMLLRRLLERVQGVYHLAAQTHVDRSILGGEAFYITDVLGTFTLLDTLRSMDDGGKKRFLHVSTDEIYGEIPAGRVDERAPLNPGNPYSSAKAGADMLARSFGRTYGLNIVIARPSNTFGPYQHPEKFVPLMTIRALKGLHLPIYGDGKQIRDWIYVEDLVRALVLIYEKGESGEAYNIPGQNERENVEVARRILEILGRPLNLIKFVKDRPGHDMRYAMDGSKLKSLGFESTHEFDEALERTVLWYRNNRSWWETIMEDEETRIFMEKWYRDR